MNEPASDPFARWLAVPDGELESVSVTEVVAQFSADELDPWAGTEVAVTGLSEAQRDFLESDQPVREPLRPALPGVEGFEADEP